MPDVGYIAIVVAGFGAYWWRHMRPARTADSVSALFTAEAEVALHVAVHEARSRNQELGSLHVLYGLLQDDEVIAAITGAGGDPTALEDRALAAIAGGDHEPWVAGRAAAIAQRAGRRASCTDLWALLGDSRAGKLLDDGQLDRRAVLFALFHGGPDPALPAPGGPDVFVVLRNDHYTTQQFVSSVLADVFGLGAARASAIMLATHTEGRAVIGRFSADAARAKIQEVRAQAGSHAFPLWIGVEPA